jgi:hypothetical protein
LEGGAMKFAACSWLYKMQPFLYLMAYSFEEDVLLVSQNIVCSVAESSAVLLAHAVLIRLANMIEREEIRWG